VNPGPVAGARLVLTLKLNGGTIWRAFGITSSAGEVTYHWRSPADGEYLATVIYLSHSQYLWDRSKGVISASYKLGD